MKVNKITWPIEKAEVSTSDFYIYTINMCTSSFAVVVAVAAAVVVVVVIVVAAVAFAVVVVGAQVVCCHSTRFQSRSLSRAHGVVIKVA